MIDAKGKYVGEICHIEGVGNGSERHNPNMSNDARASVGNLMLLCRDHHLETNDVSKYPVQKLRDMKKAHERRFSDPARTILEAISDSTEGDIVLLPVNLKRIARTLKWKLDDESLGDTLEDLVTYLKDFEKAPLPVRKFLGEVAKRIAKVYSTGAVYTVGSKACIDIADLADSFVTAQKKRLSASTWAKKASQLSDYGLGAHDEHHDGPHKRVAVLYGAGDWLLWPDLVKFSAKAGVSLESFYQDLDFTSLGE